MPRKKIVFSFLLGLSFPVSAPQAQDAIVSCEAHFSERRDAAAEGFDTSIVDSAIIRDGCLGTLLDQAEAAEARVLELEMAEARRTHEAEGQVDEVAAAEARIEELEAETASQVARLETAEARIAEFEAIEVRIAEAAQARIAAFEAAEARIAEAADARIAELEAAEARIAEGAESRVTEAYEAWIDGASEAWIAELKASEARIAELIGPVASSGRPGGSGAQFVGLEGADYTVGISDTGDIQTFSESQARARINQLPVVDQCGELIGLLENEEALADYREAMPRRQWGVWTRDREFVAACAWRNGEFQVVFQPEALARYVILTAR